MMTFFLTSRHQRRLRAAALLVTAALALSGCGFSPYKLPLPGGADTGSNPYSIKVEFRDVLDLVPQSAVRVDDVAVGKVTDVKRKGWNAEVTLEINRDAELPANAEAKIRQTSLLGEKFVSLAPPKTGASSARLKDGDVISLRRSGRNPEVEEVLSAAALLLNGGGLDQTNTIVRELNKTLGGNEPEVKELLQSTTALVSELDDNKQSLLTALEKVNRLAERTNDQKAAITGALDDLPDALQVINNQRDDLVNLLQSLNRLGDVATGVIRRSKADTLADLKNLAPVLRQLANAGDDLATSTRIALSFPFSDAIVGNSVSRAMVSCSDNKSLSANVQNGACYGDFANLDINLSLNSDQAVSLISGVLSLAGAFPDILGTAQGKPADPGSGASGSSSSDDPAAAAQSLVDSITKLLPGGSAPAPSQQQDSSSSPSPKSGSGSGSGGSSTKPQAPPVICSLLGMCRSSAASYDQAESTDVGRLLVGPAVAR